MTLNLDAMRKIAEAATPGPWIIDSLESGEHGVFIEDGNPDYLKLGCASAIVASHLVGKNADYLEAFDPETVLALITRLEQAERELVAAKSTQVQHIVRTSFETARTAGLALDEAVKIVSGWLVEDPDRRAREAEAQVDRVRELADAWKSRGEHDMAYSKTIPQEVGEVISEGGAEMVNRANLIYRALDGDTRG